MAINQFDLDFIPAACNSPLAVDDDGDICLLSDQLSILWQMVPIEQLAAEIAARFVSEESWSKNLLLWGSDREIIIKLWTEDGRPSSLSARLAVDSLSLERLDSLLSLATAIHCNLFLREARVIVRPNRETLLKCIAVSTPYRFVQNPLAFLEELSREQDSQPD